jgi:hypothetical protein
VKESCKLAVTLAAHVVGFTRPAEVNEEALFARLY